jgi:hypothetical protein
VTKAEATAYGICLTGLELEYHRADFMSLRKFEVRGALHEHYSVPAEEALQIACRKQAMTLSLTTGRRQHAFGVLSL